MNTTYENDFCCIVLLAAFIIFLMNNKNDLLKAVKVCILLRAHIQQRDLNNDSKETKHIDDRLIVANCELNRNYNFSEFFGLPCNVNRGPIQRAEDHCEDFSQIANDKTFLSSLNNLLYSCQQFLAGQTATSHASSCCTCYIKPQAL